MSDYPFCLDLTSDNANRDIIKQIKRHSTVLELGPAHGRMTQYLKEHLCCQVDIVEINAEAGKDAAPYARKALLGEKNGNLDREDWADSLEIAEYDYIIFCDVLEHLKHPGKVLQDCKRLLKDTGLVLCSIPNICHASVLLSMLNDQFEYTDTGLLDKTHIHFFTATSFKELCIECGYSIQYQHAICIPVGANEIPYTYANISRDLENILKQRTNNEAYQYIFTLKKTSESAQNNEVFSNLLPPTSRKCKCMIKESDDADFSAQKYLIKSIAPGKVSISFDLKNFPQADGILFQLIDCNALISMNRIVCIKDGQEAEIPAYDTDALRISDNHLCSALHAPSICFSLPQHEKVEIIRFEYDILVYNSDILEILGKNIIQQFMQQIDSLHRQVEAAEEATKQISDERTMLQQQLDQTTQTCLNMKVRLKEAMQNSELQNQLNAAKQQIQSLTQKKIELEAQTQAQEQEIEAFRRLIYRIEHTISYRCAAPIRLIGSVCRKGKQLVVRSFDLTGKAIRFYRQFGFKATVQRIRNNQIIEQEKKLRQEQIEAAVKNEDVWQTLSKWIDETPHEFIDIFPVPMGWNTPLFQRFQHLSLQAGNAGGISFYGAHPQVDKEVETYQFISPTLCLINLFDEGVVRQFWKLLDQKTGLKYLRLQSIDLATTIDQIKDYMARGYQIVYEYIDELTPQITGNIPQFVFDRHAYLLRNLDVTVIATSDKLYKQITPYRSTNMMMLNNGVDYDHWHIECSIKHCPDDIRSIVEQGKIIIGYHGALAQWIDYDLLGKIADDDRFILLLIGYEHDGNLKKSGLLNRKNVFFIGPRPYQELNQYAAFYDIAILPFVINNITLSVSPVKIFEYMAADKPVVSYALPECKKYASCLCAQTQEEFIALIEKAVQLRNDPAYHQQLRDDALRNTWLSITKQMIEYVKSAYLRKQRMDQKQHVLNNRLSSESKDACLEQMLALPKYRDNAYQDLTEHPYSRKPTDCKIIAYYLTQYHPDAHNEAWWGRGSTEWNNVCRAVPQYKGHYQPRLPGELGFYDLRIKETMARQIELAKMYGIYGFSFYYYWFNGERLLERPLEAFLNSPDLDFPFSLCWANENWTKRYDGTNTDILMEQPKSAESYKNVIHDMARFLKDPRYIEVRGKKLITLYRPSLMPERKRVLLYWRNYCAKHGIGELYIIAIKENMIEFDWLGDGFDAISEFHPGTLYTNCLNITSGLEFLRKDFAGEVFSYPDIVHNKKYFRYNYPKLYRAVMPMWDNTARRDHKGMIFEGSTPELYKQWLKDIITSGTQRSDLDDNLIFINAWNEWGEGAYLEPDKRYGYAYLQATKEAVEECRKD